MLASAAMRCSRQPPLRLRRGTRRRTKGATIRRFRTGSRNAEQGPGFRQDLSRSPCDRWFGMSAAPGAGNERRASCHIPCQARGDGLDDFSSTHGGTDLPLTAHGQAEPAGSHVWPRMRCRGVTGHLNARPDVGEPGGLGLAVGCQRQVGPPRVLTRNRPGRLPVPGKVCDRKRVAHCGPRCSRHANQRSQGTEKILAESGTLFGITRPRSEIADGRAPWSGGACPS